MEPKVLKETINNLTDEYISNNGSLDNSKLTYIQFNLELCKEILIEQKNDYTKEEYELLYNKLNICLAQIKKSYTHDEKPSIYTKGFAVVWTLGLLSGLIGCGLLIIGVLYLI